MRRSIIYYIIAFVLIGVTVTAVAFAVTTEDVRRHHQHMQRPSEADLGACLRCEGDVLCTHLPIIIIDTHGVEVPGRPTTFLYEMGDDYYDFVEVEVRTFETTPDGENEIEVSVRVIDNTNDWSHTDDSPMLETSSMMRIRGNSSRFFDKPNYRLSLICQYGENNNLPLLGMAPHFEWSLHGPFLDKTLMRNYVWMNVAADVMGPGHFVPEVRFFELILNGEYQGVYVLMETIRVSPHRLDMNRYRPGMPATSYLTRMDTYWIFNHERAIYTLSYYTHRMEESRELQILYPRYYYQSDTVRDYVTRSVSEIARLLYSPEIVWYTRPHEQYMDIDSFVNFFIINEFIINNDLWANSTFLHKDVRGRLVAGPVWDFNNVMDNFFFPMPYDQFYLANRGWHARLMMCPDFTDQVIRRYRDLRRYTLNEGRLIGYMLDVQYWLGSAVDRNFEVWGYSFDPFEVNFLSRRAPQHQAVMERMPYYFEDLDPRARERLEREIFNEMILELNPASFEEAMDHHIQFTINRGRWLDAYIESLRQYSHPSRHALWTLR